MKLRGFALAALAGAAIHAAVIVSGVLASSWRFALALDGGLVIVSAAILVYFARESR